jgi:hypothetical protein
MVRVPGIVIPARLLERATVTALVEVVVRETVHTATWARIIVPGEQLIPDSCAAAGAVTFKVAVAEALFAVAVNTAV